jgi:ribose 5-phosphate isomerase A
MSNSAQQQKKLAAEYAVEAVQSGMTVGLGTGSTAVWAVRKLAELLADGRLKEVWAIPTSGATQAEAERLSIPLTDLETAQGLDLTIDGADEVDPHKNVIKGGGGALMREKIVAEASRRLIIVVDESKHSPLLGTQWALPIEVSTFGWGSQKRFLEALGAAVSMRLSEAGSPFQTDGGNLVLDANFGPLRSPEALANRLAQRSGILEHGLFLGLVSQVITATADGIKVMD